MAFTGVHKLATTQTDVWKRELLYPVFRYCGVAYMTASAANRGVSEQTNVRLRKVAWATVLLHALYLADIDHEMA